MAGCPLRAEDGRRSVRVQKRNATAATHFNRYRPKARKEPAKPAEEDRQAKGRGEEAKREDVPAVERASSFERVPSR